MNKVFHFFCLLLLSVTSVFAQDGTGTPFRIVLPSHIGWSTVNEGDTISFQLNTLGGKGGNITYSVSKGLAPGMRLDSLTGQFSFTPGYDMVEARNNSIPLSVLFEAQNDSAEVALYDVIFKIVHTNRPPVIDVLKPFYVQLKVANTYKIEPSVVTDPDNDAYTFHPVLETFPEGMQLSENGVITWEPSLVQFNILKNSPRYIEFWVEDQPHRARTKGRLKLEQTQRDLPPSITLVPNTKIIRASENGMINIKFFLGDPNGEDDIARFSFVSDNKSVPQKALVKNSDTNYEFIWEPGYDFVKEPMDTLRFNVTFFVLDKAQNRDERTIQLAIGNTVNIEAQDQYLYNQYRQALASAWNLMEQLNEKETYLKRRYVKAKKGKGHRSLFNAAIGATTGLTPVITKDPETRSKITTIGGTTIATFGTLEATDIIGKSLADVNNRYNLVLDKKTELFSKADAFAREFATKASRIKPDFIPKLDAFKQTMSVKGLVALELDANWETKKVATDNEIKKRFKDFAPYSNKN